MKKHKLLVEIMKWWSTY